MICDYKNIFEVNIVCDCQERESVNDMSKNLRKEAGEPVTGTCLLADRTRTESLCPVCLRRLPAQRLLLDDGMHLAKKCSQHGAFQTPIWRGLPAFDQWQRQRIPVQAPVQFTGSQKGCPFDCGLCPDHQQRPCTIVLEVTQRCNLACSVCYAAAPADTPDPSPVAVAEMFRRAAQAGPGSNIQLSGGEPTIRDDLPALVAMGRDAGFKFIQVNTNGLRLGRDRAFVKALKQAGLASIFLQFDGLDDHVYRKLRGRDLMAEKRCAIEACAEQGLGVVLVPTLVPGINTGQIGAILQAALSWAPTVRGVHFQPISYFGRYSTILDGANRITLPEVMCAIETQSAGRFKAAHLRPPGCENALCSFHGRFIQLADGKMVPLKASASEDCGCASVRADEAAARAMACMARQWAGPGQLAMKNAAHSDCTGQHSAGRSGKGEPPASMSLDDFIHQGCTHIFSISGMAFQDAWTVALDRVRDCCIHVITPDGRLIPFCLYNLTAADGRRLYRT